MKVFAGFPGGKTRFTPIPDLFFSDLLAAIDDLAELKLTLYLFWSLNRQRGYPRYLTLAELEAEGSLLSALPCPPGGEPSPVLHEAIERAVARGTVIRLTISNAEGETDYYFVNTPQGRKAVEQVKRGELILETAGRVREPHIDKERLNIFQLYEQNIGLLQPLLAEELEEAERNYPEQWIRDAFRIAVGHNVRRWRYIASILERWARDGKDDGEPLQQRRTRRQGVD
jgi:DNA replication protein